MVPSFFFDLESPSVDAYKKRQKAVLDNAIGKKQSIMQRVSNAFAPPAPPRAKEVQIAMYRASQTRASYLKTGKLPAELADLDMFAGNAPPESAPSGAKKGW